ncbi:hypothetical protein AWB67_05620 [Caballeronia terrestris]|uniref:Lipoprotein n=1 Tax=Caballeronia terrestris TaxID=1226301 RepID=A0A158KH92_9BURK|nr:hypothetical protein [Caballeronia terrestris]SAL80424.1 hypothetical protein AWB67_05620 [Caballeronia terrestris]
MRKLLLALVFVPRLAFASDWTVVNAEVKDWRGYRAHETGDGKMQNSTVSIVVDRDSIVTNGKYKKVYWKQIANKDGYTLDQIYLSRYNCEAHTQSFERLGSRTASNLPYKWVDIAFNPTNQPPKNGEDFGVGFEPDDPADHVFSAVCLNKWKQG